MCGIAGIIKLNGPTAPEDVAAVQRMMEAQVHRGPDGAGWYQDTHVVLGHRRLSIIDLSDAGNQPMTNEEKTVWVTYNGEIYNFQELRADLISRSHLFRSKTDTEVLVHGYQEWGLEGLLSRLRGMFAFGLWDQKSQRMVLARDRLGKKPLYYAWGVGALIFASELKALLASGLIERRLNPAAVVAYLTLGSVPAPLTMIEGIQALPPGSTITLQDGRLELKRYWQLTFDAEPSLTEVEAVEQVGSLLQEAVRLRLVADVPVGAFLSGGIDSSSIVALMREATGGTIRTFSLVFREQEFSEGPFAALVAQKFGTEHIEYVMTAEEVCRELPQIIRAMDQPTIDGVNAYFVSKITRESGIIVALSGIGGDELFGGYASFQLVPRLYRISQIAHAVPGCTWALGKALGAKRRDGRIHKLRSLFRYSPSPEMAYLAVRGLFLDGELQALLHPDLLNQPVQQFTPLGYLHEIISEQHTESLPNLVSWLELRSYMHNQLLRDTDGMSMAHSLEVRTPFLDHRLVEFLAQVPVRVKFAGRPKSLLLNALGGYLPREVVDRPKGTFTFPFEQWLRTEWQTAVQGELQIEKTGILDSNAVVALWQRFLRGEVHWSRVWAIIVLKRWLEQMGELAGVTI